MSSWKSAMLNFSISGSLNSFSKLHSCARGVVALMALPANIFQNKRSKQLFLWQPRCMVGVLWHRCWCLFSHLKCGRMPTLVRRPFPHDEGWSFKLYSLTLRCQLHCQEGAQGMEHHPVEGIVQWQLCSSTDKDHADQGSWLQIWISVSQQWL